MTSHFVIPAAAAMTPPRPILAANTDSGPLRPFQVFDAWNKQWVPPVNYSSVQTLIGAAGKSASEFLCQGFFDGGAIDPKSGDTFRLAQLSFDTLIAEPTTEWKAVNCQGTEARSEEEREDPSPRVLSDPTKRPKAIPSVQAVVHSLEEGDKEVYSLSFLAESAPGLTEDGVRAVLCSSKEDVAGKQESAPGTPSSNPSTPDLVPFELDWGARMTSGAPVTQIGDFLVYQPPAEWREANCREGYSVATKGSALKEKGKGKDGRVIKHPLTASMWKKGGHPIPVAAAYIPPTSSVAEAEEEGDVPLSLPPYQLLLTGLQVHSVTGVRPEEQLQGLLCQSSDDFWPGKTDSGRRFKQLTDDGVVLKPTSGFVASYCSQAALDQAAKDAGHAAAAIRDVPVSHSYWPLQSFAFHGDELLQNLPTSLSDALEPHAAADVPLPLAYLYDRESSSWQAAYTEEWLATKLDLPKKVIITWLKEREASPQWIKRLFTTTEALVTAEGSTSDGATLNFSVTVHTVANSFATAGSPFSSFVLSEPYHRARLSVHHDDEAGEAKDMEVIKAMALGERPTFEPSVGTKRRPTTASAAR
jgi:hypothetical protein